MQKTVKFLILLTFLFLIIVFYLSLGKDNSYNTENLIGKKIELIYFESFDNNDTLNTLDFKKNNLTLINFWASWCGPCRVEHPILMKLSSEKNLKLVGVNFKDNKQQAKTFLGDLGNPYDFLAKDSNGKQSINFGIYGIPESILINNELKIIKKFIGPLNKEDYKTILAYVK
mgnify:FL=1|tara:strand:+ start:16 stop:531 length:516 start_codon:yes stop_codon:yes gene_type:complete